MPKVSEEYKHEKKQFIMESLRGLARKKPISAISMQELITTTGMSQGAIYRYYKDIDEVIGDLYEWLSEQEKDVEAAFNRVFTEDSNTCTDSGDKIRMPEQVLYEAFQCVADFYMQENSVFDEVNRMIWSLNDVYLYDKQRVKRIIRDTEKDNITVRVRGKLLQYIQARIEEGYFQPQMSIPKISAFVAGSFDGIVHNYDMVSYYNKKDYSPIQSEMKDLYSMMDVLAKMVIQLLHGDLNKLIQS